MMTIPDPNFWYVVTETQIENKEPMTILEKIVLAVLMLLSGGVFVGTIYMIWIIVWRLTH